MKRYRRRELMDRSAKLWMLKHIRKNYWRVASWIDLDDLVQDGNLKYQIIRTRYPQAINPGHIMRLFQISFINHIHTLSDRKTIQTEVAFAEFTPEAVHELERINPCEFAELLSSMAEMPERLQRCLERIMASPEEMRKPYRRTKRKGRETLNERLCGLVGLDPKSNDLHTDLVTYLKS